MAEEWQPYRIKSIKSPVMLQTPSEDATLSKLFDIALRFHNQRNLPEAEKIYREILRVDFDHPDAWHLLGVLASQSGYYEVAREFVEEAIALSSEEPVYHNNLGNVYKNLGDLDAALRSYDKALTLRPDYGEAHYNRATILRSQNKLEQAADTYRAALRLRPEALEVLNDLAGALRQQGEVSAAIECYRTALARHPDNADLHLNLGLALEQQGDHEAAIQCYRKALELKPTHAQAHLCLVDLTPNSHETISELRELLKNRRLGDADREYLCWALGKACDDCQRYGEAFQYYAAANDRRRVRKAISFDRQAQITGVSQLIDAYTEELFDEGRTLGSDSELPVFIIGLPRSGKSLTEGLLSEHPDVVAGGELVFFGQVGSWLQEQLGTSIPYPDCVRVLDQPVARSLAEIYLGQLRKRSRDALRVSNSYPNFLNVGLITLLFPKARIFHCRRNPIDLCLSIYFKSFARGHSYAYDLEDIAAYYHEYERLMKHWYRVLPGKLLPIDYEELVTNPEEMYRRLVEWCGLDPDATASARTRDEVGRHKPLHTRFVRRWEHYDEFIEPLRRELGILESGGE